MTVVKCEYCEATPKFITCLRCNGKGEYDQTYEYHQSLRYLNRTYVREVEDESANLRSVDIYSDLDNNQWLQIRSFMLEYPFEHENNTVFDAFKIVLDKIIKIIKSKMPPQFKVGGEYVTRGGDKVVITGFTPFNEVGGAITAPIKATVYLPMPSGRYKSVFAIYERNGEHASERFDIVGPWVDKDVEGA